MADILNIGFWSPRLLASRIQAPTQLLDPNVRRLAAENMVASFGIGMSILAIVKTWSELAGNEDVKVELNPKSTDFGQIRAGSTRINFWGGFQPLARYTEQIRQNQTKNRGTGEITGGEKFPFVNRADRLEQFGRSKLSPGIVSLIANELFGRTFIGESLEEGKDDEGVKEFLAGEGKRSDKGRLPDPVDTLADKLGIDSVREVEALSQVIPLFNINLIDAIDEYGFLKGSGLGTLELFGVGANTFNEPRAEAAQAQQQQQSAPGGTATGGAQQRQSGGELGPVGGGSWFENR